MQVTPKSRRAARAQNAVFLVLLLVAVGLLAWLSTRYNYHADWTADTRRSLSAASVQLLGKIEGPVTITAFARDDRQIRRAISDLIERYQHYKQDIILDFVNPDTEPQRVRDMGVSSDGELVLTHGGRTEHLKPFEMNEQAMTNALQRILRAGERWVVFLDGHGERRPHAEGNHDVSLWVKELENKGFKARAVNLAESAVIPDNTTVLVIAGPQVDLLPGEIKAVQEYVERGGNLLWLSDPGPQRGLEALATQLGVHFLPGAVVDLTTQLLGIQSAAIAAVTSYPPHPITRDFALLTVFPLAVGLSLEPDSGWQGEAFLRTGSGSWEETGALAAEVQFDENQDIRGPITLGVSLTRARGAAAEGGAQGERQQRVVVIGDGDFLSNRYLGNVGNLDMGMNIVNWLSADEQLISIPAKTALDSGLTLTPLQSSVIGFGFLMGLPALLLGSGLVIWWRRRKR